MKKDKKQPDDTKKENKAISSFENFFYRYVAWFPILTLPTIVWEMFATGETMGGALIGIMHAVLVLRFTQVIDVSKWFQRKKKNEPAK
ncbi:MAG: olfactory receptor family 2 protein [Oceanobacter sp.]